MEGVEDEARCPPNSRSRGQQSAYGSSVVIQKLPAMSASNERQNRYVGDGDVDGDEEDNEEETGDENGNQNDGLAGVANDLDDEEDDDEEDDDDDDGDGDDDTPDQQKNFGGSVGDFTKKRKLKSLVSSYEFAPRVPAPQPEPLVEAPPSSASKPSYGGRNALTDWTEAETFVLLDSWGDRFLQHGRKSLRSDEWLEVAEKVSEVSKIERTDAQCRNRLDTLKKKYKKEKLKLSVESGNAPPTKWIYFKKMDVLMSSPPQTSSAAGLSCGVDSGEYTFTNPKTYLNRANGIDEMRDSPGNSEFSNRDEDDDDNDDSDGLPPKKRRSRRESNEEGSSFKLLADSIVKFSDIYEKIENQKSQQMREIEKMRMDFQRELEIQRRQIMEKVQAEIAKLMEFDDVDNDNDQSDENGNR